MKCDLSREVMKANIHVSLQLSSLMAVLCVVLRHYGCDVIVQFLRIVSHLLGIQNFSYLRANIDLLTWN